MKRSVSTATVLGVAIVLAMSIGMRADEPKVAPAPEFDGKFVLVFLTGRHADSEHPVALQNPRTVQIGDRTFLAGALVNGGDFGKTMFPGRRAWLPVSDIAKIVAFDSVDQMKVP